MSSRLLFSCFMVAYGLIWVAESINLLNTSTSKIVGSSTGIQYLPESYVRSFDRWRVTGVESKESIRLEPILPTEITTSLSKLFPKRNKENNSMWVRPSLQVLINGGISSYIMAGVDVSVTGSANDDNGSSLVWGSPAQQRTTFGLAAEPNFRVMLFVGDGDGTDDLISKANAASVRQTIGWLGEALQLPESNQLSHGFHIISLPLLSEGSERREEDSSKQDSSWTLLAHPRDSDQKYSLLTCLATAEQDAREILTLDPLLAEMTFSSILQVPLPPQAVRDVKVEGGTGT